jgi:SMC interacting uncharacterized protein involved in chromosome segregation
MSKILKDVMSKVAKEEKQVELQAEKVELGLADSFKSTIDQVEKMNKDWDTAIKQLEASNKQSEKLVKAVQDADKAYDKAVDAGGKMSGKSDKLVDKALNLLKKADKAAADLGIKPSLIEGYNKLEKAVMSLEDKDPIFDQTLDEHIGWIGKK